LVCIYSINSIKSWARISPSRGQDIIIHPLRRLTSSLVNPNLGTPLLDTFVCLVSSYVMSCDHFGPTYVMRHIPEPPSPHTPVKLRGSALIPFETSRSLLHRRYLLLTALYNHISSLQTNTSLLCALCTHSYAPKKTFWSITHLKLFQAKHA
jgi:hypothetical protein